jgi:1-acyl-sn-glycerol-3-phosphate acyltransferase
MPTTPTVPPKPKAEVIRPEITFAPRFTIGRQLARRGIKYLTRFLVWMWLKLSVNGLENIPEKDRHCWFLTTWAMQTLWCW